MSFNLINFKGIKVRIHWTFILLFIGILIGTYLIQGTNQAIIASLLIIGVFGSVLVHEFAHSLVSGYYGYPAKVIILYPLGGMANIPELSIEPKKELFISLIGPLSNYGIAALSFSMYMILKNNTFTFMEIPIADYFSVFGSINILLGSFNLFIPAIPMDGGRILRALLATQMSFPKATRYAVQASQIIAIVLGIIGLFTNFWLIFIALFVYFGASAEMENSLIRYYLDEIPIKDVMTTNVKRVTSGTTVTQLLDRMLDEGHLGYVVSADNGDDIGVVTLQDAREIPKEDRNLVKVAQIMKSDIIRLNPSDPATQAFYLLKNHDIGRVLITTNKNPFICKGIVTRSDILRYIQIIGVKRAKDGN